jgi:hypothetical protein
MAHHHADSWTERTATPDYPEHGAARDDLEHHARTQGFKAIAATARFVRRSICLAIMAPAHVAHWNRRAVGQPDNMPSAPWPGLVQI